MRFYILLLLVFLGGCGYSPSAKFAKAVMGEKISTSVVISELDPQNTVIIKDAVDRAVIEVFQASLTDRASSTSHLDINMAPPVYTPIAYDNQGFIVSYRMQVSLQIIQTKNGTSTPYSTRGFYDFNIEPNAIVTDKDRFTAIDNASQRAIRAFISQVAAKGARELK